MDNRPMFSVVVFGYEKNEVRKYLASVNEETERLKKRVLELEDIAVKKQASIDEKSNELSRLLDELETARKQAGGKLTEMSSLVERMGQNEKALRKDFDEKEAEYKARIMELERAIESNEANFARAKATLEDAKAKAEKMKADAMVQCENMKDKCAREIDVYRARGMADAEEEIALKRNDIAVAQKKLQEIADAVDDSKTKFALEYSRMKEECDRIKKEMQELM